MRWLLLLGIALIVVGIYMWLIPAAPETFKPTNYTLLKVDRMMGTRMCPVVWINGAKIPYDFASLGGMLWLENGTPVNFSKVSWLKGKYLAVNGVVTNYTLTMECLNPKEGGYSNVTKSIKAIEVKGWINAAYCESDEDCVPAQCCHANACVNKEFAPNCTKVYCTMECRPGTMDCGQGYCACINNTCQAVILKKL